MLNVLSPSFPICQFSMLQTVIHKVERKKDQIRCGRTRDTIFFYSNLHSTPLSRLYRFGCVNASHASCSLELLEMRRWLQRAGKLTSSELHTHKLFSFSSLLSLALTDTDSVFGAEEKFYSLQLLSRTQQYCQTPVNRHLISIKQVEFPFKTTVRHERVSTKRDEAVGSMFCGGY